MTLGLCPPFRLDRSHLPGFWGAHGAHRRRRGCRFGDDGSIGARRYLPEHIEARASAAWPQPKAGLSLALAPLPSADHPPPQTDAEWLAEHIGETSNEGPRRLAAAVINQALADAFGAWDASPRERNHARLFLTEDKGEWADARAALCDGVDIDPDALRQHVLRRCQGIRQPDAGETILIPETEQTYAD